MQNRWLYPANWPALALACKERAGWRCESCGVRHGTVAVSVRTGQVYCVSLAACHINHDAWNPEPELRCWCPSCHMRYDYSYQQRERRVALERIRHQVWLQQYQRQVASEG